MAAKAQQRRLPAASAGTGEEPSRASAAVAVATPEGVPRLTNRIAVQTFLTAFALVVGLISLPGVLEGATTLGRVLAPLPLAAALGLAAWGARLRADLRRAQGQAAPGSSPARP